jgi:hypothetical protein
VQGVVVATQVIVSLAVSGSSAPMELPKAHIPAVIRQAASSVAETSRLPLTIAAMLLFSPLPQHAGCGN